MEKMILADKTELEIQEGASLGAITVVADSISALEPVKEAIKKKGNLDKVQFKTDDLVTGEYEDMILESPLFSAVDETEEGKVYATFGIREKTDLEKRVDTLEGRADVTEGALQEVILSTIVGGEA